MLPLNADNLCLLSTTLCCATRTQTWKNLGTFEKSKQEEIQMMRIGDSSFFIACNHDGHELLNPFLKMFNVNSADTLADSVKWCNFIINAETKTLNSWGANLGKRSTFSEQENKTIGCFASPADIPQMAKPIDIYLISRCVWKNANKPAVIPPDYQEGKNNDWMAAIFRQLLAVAPSKTNPPAAPRTASFTTLKIGGDVNLNDQVTLITDSQEVHAELKLLALLTKMILDAKVSPGTTVYLGGLKRACKKCDAWIAKYQTWLGGQNITLSLPAADNRPSANPGIWGNPAVEQNVKAALPDLFA